MSVVLLIWKKNTDIYQSLIITYIYLEWLGLADHDDKKSGNLYRLQKVWSEHP